MENFLAFSGDNVKEKLMFKSMPFLKPLKKLFTESNYQLLEESYVRPNMPFESPIFFGNHYFRGYSPKNYKF